MVKRFALYLSNPFVDVSSKSASALMLLQNQLCFFTTFLQQIKINFKTEQHKNIYAVFYTLILQNKFYMNSKITVSVSVSFLQNLKLTTI